MYDQPPTLTATDEARRQIEICNACRYCEGYCAVFPSAFGQRAFSDGDITQLASLCHNCRGCYYACQYTEPHEFALKPAGRAGRGPRRKLGAFRLALGLRTPLPAFGRGAFAGAGDRDRRAVLGLDGARPRPPARGSTPISRIPAMVANFSPPAFLLPLAAIAIGLRRYWAKSGGEPLRWPHVKAALVDAAQLRNLSGGAARGGATSRRATATRRRAAMRIRRCSGASCCASPPPRAAPFCTTSSTGRRPTGSSACQSFWACRGDTAGAGLRAADPAEAQGRRRPRRAVGLGRGGGLRGTAGPDGPDRPRAFTPRQAPRWSRRFWHCISERSSPSS